jgi:hypothetical protein
MEALEKEFARRASGGVVMSRDEMLEFCRRRGVSVDREALGRLRATLRHTALFAQNRRPPRYMSSSIPKYGTIMVDMAYFRPDLRVANGQMAAFLVAVECLSGKVSVVPCTGGTQKEWERAVRIMVEHGFDSVSHVITDQDASVTGADFRERVERELGVTWSFLTRRSKAFKAERAIRWLKQALSVALAANRRGDLGWVRHLPGIVAHHNSQTVPGTSIVRSSVNKRNYLEVLEELYRTDDPTVLFNLTESANHPPEVARALWRYDVGDRVLVSRKVDDSLTRARVDPETGDTVRKRGKFEKPSEEGSFGPRVHVVTARKLKHNWKLFIVPVYAVDSLRGWWYETELRRALFAGGGLKPRAAAATATAE